MASLGQRQQTLQQREREAELRFRGEAIAKAIAAYMGASPAGTNSLPQRLEDLLEDRRSGTVQRHLRRLYADPFTGRTDWQLILGQASVKKKPDQDDASSEVHEKKPPASASQLGSAAASEEQGTPMVSGIVGVSSRSRALLLASSTLGSAAEAASAPTKTRKPRVSELHFMAPTESLAPE
ncbi:hypothetical protein [Roseateles oligotrophus]|uniref:hypothetical protein n=1 Tax=Roseateles oligotrophus TaxID=1769250 RepID=UPI0021E47FE3|nr:hypothetical protein [Roseateles oligotrophus]